VTPQARGGIASAAGIVTLVGIASGNPYWVLFGVIALIVIGLAEAWWRWGSLGLEYRRVLAASTATCGDIVDCTIDVTNRKLLPMPWVDVWDDWPSALVPDRVRARKVGLFRPAETVPKLGGEIVSSLSMPRDEGGVAQQTDRESVSQRLTLAPFERVRRTYRVPCRRRGAYDFGPVAIRWRDAFGLTSRDADFDSRIRLVVYPRVLPVAAPPAAARELLGDRVRPRALLTDPTRLAGVRPFVSGDSVRRVHWGATARTGILQVRRDDPTAGRRLLIVIDVETEPEDRWWSAGDTDVHETVVLVAASIASWALRSGTAVGLTANGRTSGSAHDLWVPCAENPRQLTRVLDGLARLRPWPSRPLRDAIGLTSRSWPRNATIALVSTRPSASKLRAINRASRDEQPVVTIDCGSDASREAPNVAGGTLLGSPALWRLADPETPWSTRADIRLV
jgi:uncharacterized protein (DUF58 family)